MEVVRGIAATLRFPEADGDAVSLSDPKVTVVRDSDGKVIVAAQNATEVPAVEANEESEPPVLAVDAFWKFELKGSDIPEVDLLIVTWEDANSTIEQHVEVVGGVACSIKAIKKKLNEDEVDLPTDDEIVLQRERATRDIESACWDAFRHRYAKETLSGDNDRNLILNHRRVVKILSIEVNGELLGPTELEELSITRIGIERNWAVWPDTSLRGTGWPEGINNIVVAYVYGHDNFPSAANPVRDLVADYLVDPPTNWAGRATSYTDTDGNNYRMVVAGEPGKTGSKGRRFNVPSVNAFVDANESVRLL